MELADTGTHDSAITETVVFVLSAAHFSCTMIISQAGLSSLPCVFRVMKTKHAIKQH